MPTGALMIDRVCRVTGMNITASSADRALILTFLQEAVDTVAAEAEINFDPVQSVSLTAGTATYTLGTSPFNISDLISIDFITVTDSANTNMPLEYVTMAEMIYRRQGAGQANACPFSYAVDYPTIVFYPTPDTATTLNVHYVANSVTLADSSTALTFIPTAYRWGCLVNYAIAKAFQYKKNAKEAASYMAMFEGDRVNGLPALRRWKRRVGGRQTPGTPPFRARIVASPGQDFGPF